MSQLSIIIVTYNSADYIKQCLQSVLVALNAIDYQIIVVDNNSSDNILGVIKKFHNIKTILNKENLGFARACNQGIKIAQGEFVLLLNPDTTVKEGAIQKMIQFMKKSPEVGILGGKILNPNGTLQFSCGHFPTIFRIIIDRLPFLNQILPAYLIRQKSYYQEIQFPDWVMGSCMLIRKSLFEKIGYFDENYFMYKEEVDLCYRAKKKGIKIQYLPHASLIHFDQGRSPQRRWKKFVQMRFGFLYFFKKYYAKSSFRLLKIIFNLDIRWRTLCLNLLGKFYQDYFLKKESYQKVLKIIKTI